MDKGTHHQIADVIVSLIRQQYPQNCVLIAPGQEDVVLTALSKHMHIEKHPEEKSTLPPDYVGTFRGVPFIASPLVPASQIWLLSDKGLEIIDL